MKPEKSAAGVSELRGVLVSPYHKPHTYNSHVHTHVLLLTLAWNKSSAELNGGGLCVQTGL